MGYSVYVEFKDQESKNHMFDFLEREYMDINGLAGFELSYAMAAELDDNLSYANKKHKFIVGFDYQSWIDYFERNYVNALMRWVAITSSSKELVENRPFYIYDGEDNEFFTCDNEHGYKLMVQHSGFMDKDHLAKYNILLKNELLRLTERWQEEQTEPAT